MRCACAVQRRHLRRSSAPPPGRSKVSTGRRASSGGRTLTRSSSSKRLRMFSSSTLVRRRYEGVSAGLRRVAAPRTCTPPGSVTAESMRSASCRELMSSFQRFPATCGHTLSRHGPPCHTRCVPPSLGPPPRRLSRRCTCKQRHLQSSAAQHWVPARRLFRGRTATSLFTRCTVPHVVARSTPSTSSVPCPLHAA